MTQHSARCDAAGLFVHLEWTYDTVDDLASSLPAERPVVVFGLARLSEAGLVMRGLDLVGASLRTASRGTHADLAGLPIGGGTP